MKNLILSLCLFVAASVATVPVFVACSTSSQLTATQSVLAVQTAVHNTMESYRDAVTLGKVSLADRIEVRNQYRKYEVMEAQVIAGLAIGTDLDTVTDEELANLAFELTVFILTLID